MAKIVVIKDKDEVVYPITKPEAVIGNDGVSIEQKLSEAKEYIDNAIAQAITTTLNTEV